MFQCFETISIVQKQKQIVAKNFVEILLMSVLINKQEGVLNRYR